MVQPTNIIFSDFKTNLTAHPVSGDISLNINLDAIKQAVKNIILTQHFERPFKPFLGSNVTHFLFENFDGFTEDNIRDSIIESIDNNESRAEILDVRVNSEPDNNRFNVDIIFRGVNNTDPVKLQVFLTQVR